MGADVRRSRAELLGISDCSPSFVPFRREAKLGRISSACKEICQGMAWYVLPKWQVKGTVGRSFVGAL